MKLASRIAANISNPLAVRGASLKPANMRVGKSRAQVKPLDVWREVVQKRYNPELKFLNLEVRVIQLIFWSSLLNSNSELGGRRNIEEEQYHSARQTRFK